MNSDLLSDWLAYINSNRPNEGDFGLERLQGIYLEIVKRPIAKKTVLIGGTNGKGTTAEYLKNFFIASGKKVGVYTSPHLIKFNERIQINNISSSDETIINSFEKIDKIKNKTRLTYFDFATLAAFDIFLKEDLDIAILEIGIGGKFDPVNLVDADLSIITNIELDHEKWLGSSLEEIGHQKAAVLKPGKLAILGAGIMPASVISRAKKTCTYYQLNSDFLIQEYDSGWSYNFLDKHFEIKGLPYGNLSRESAASAITAFQLLSDEDVDFKSIIERTNLKGRCDVIDNFILDVSHNPASVKNLISFVAKSYKDTKFSAIFSSMNDKDNVSIINEISHLINQWNICSISDDRFDAESLMALTKTLTDTKINKLTTVYSAVERGYHEGTPQIVFGSFITVSEAYKALEKIKSNL